MASRLVPWACVALWILTSCGAGRSPAAPGPEIDGGPATDGGSRTDGGSGADGGDSDGGRTARDGGAGAPDGGPAGFDDASVVWHDIPETVLTGQAFRVTIAVANRGTTTWTRQGGYKLGGVGDADPFTFWRVELPADLALRGDPADPPAHQFTLSMVAPRTPGVYLTDWQMLREHVHWFGGVASATVEVRAPEGCSPPLPPPVERLRVVIHNDQGWKKVLDSTPLVYGREYCVAIGFTDGRLFCPPRPEGHPETEACNEVAVGRARDTGRVGPTWTFNGAACQAGASEGVCVNHSDNQFLVFVFGSGTAQACTASGVCGEIVIP
jgi:hypothetical protein